MCSTWCPSVVLAHGSTASQPPESSAVIHLVLRSSPNQSHRSERQKSTVFTQNEILDYTWVSHSVLDSFGNIFTPVCDSVHRGGSLSGGGGVLSGGLCPGGSLSSGGRPPCRHTVTWGRYGSYWNAFLSILIFTLKSKCIVFTTCKIIRMRLTGGQEVLNNNQILFSF